MDERIIKVARGIEKADLVIKNARIVNKITFIERTLKVPRYSKEELGKCQK